MCSIVSHYNNPCHYVAAVYSTGTSGLPDMYTRSPRACRPEGGQYQAGHECLCYSYYVTLPLHATGFTIFIVVLITFDCGFELWCLFYVFNTSTIVLIYQQREGTVFVGTISCLHIVLSLYLVGDYMKGVFYLKLT